MDMQVDFSQPSFNGLFPMAPEAAMAVPPPWVQAMAHPLGHVNHMAFPQPQIAPEASLDMFSQRLHDIVTDADQHYHRTVLAAVGLEGKCPMPQQEFF
jgi:hypothetical protein